MPEIRPPGPASPGQRAALALWQGALWAGMPFVDRYLARRAQGDADYAAHPEERRGRGAPFDADLWVHAVSMGEMRSAAPLVELALARDWRVVTTHATPAGRRAAEGTFGPAIAEGRMAVRYAPIDRVVWWRRFLGRTRPAAGVVMEMEFWPGMIEAAARENVPLILANAQVPSQSFARAKVLARSLGHPVARAAAVWAKSERMAERFRALGASRVEVLGETRFDIEPPKAHLDAARRLKNELGQARPVVTFASVVEGEEDVVLAAIARLHLRHPELLSIWVPRAPELFEATAARIAGAGLSLARRSRDLGAGLTGSLPEGCQVLLGDSLGEMFFYLELAHVVVVGGGFVEKGAHNVIEPLSLGKPVVTGPHVWTIEFPAVEAEAAGVLKIVPAEDLAEAVEASLDAVPSGAEAFHAAHRGASGRMIARLEALMR